MIQDDKIQNQLIWFESFILFECLFNKLYLFNLYFFNFIDSDLQTAPLSVLNTDIVTCLIHSTEPVCFLSQVWFRR